MKLKINLMRSRKLVCLLRSVRKWSWELQSWKQGEVKWTRDSKFVRIAPRNSMRQTTSIGVAEPIETCIKETMWTCGGAAVKSEEINLVANSKNMRAKKTKMIKMMKLINNLTKPSTSKRQSANAVSSLVILLMIVLEIPTTKQMRTWKKECSGWRNWKM